MTVNCFRELYNSLLNPQQGQVADRYFILADSVHMQMLKKIGAYYTNKVRGAKSAILNVPVKVNSLLTEPFRICR